jgi:hypothetical protein
MNDYREWLESGKKSLESGRVAEARRLLIGAVQINPQGEEGWVYLAATLPAKQAYEALKRALEINPGNYQAQRGIEILNSQLQTEVVDPVESLFEELSVEERKARRRLSRPIPAETETLPYLFEEPDEIRKLLTKPYLEERQQPRRKKRSGVITVIFAIFVVIVIGVVLVYLLNITTTSGEAGNNAVTEAVTLTVEVPSSTVSFTLVSAETSSPTNIPATPTTPPFLNLQVVLNEKSVLKGFNLIFANYDNRSANFSFSGAGTPSVGKHFEGVQLEISNSFYQALPIDLNSFQGTDSRNRFLTPVANGRLPNLSIKRLLPGESYITWLTFELEDGTNLRKVSFIPQYQLDNGNSVEVNLSLPAVSPQPTNRPLATPQVSPTPRAEITAISTITPTKIPATPLPNTIAATTTLAVPTLTPVVVTQDNVLLATVTPTALPEPTATATPLPTATSIPTPTPILPTVPPTTTPLPVPTQAVRIPFNQRSVIGDYALTVSQYQPIISAKPSLIPSGYHYEAVKITLEKTGSEDVSEFVNSYPVYLKDGFGRIYPVGPYTLEAKDRFDPLQFATTAKGPGKNSVSGFVYFLVSDNARNLPRSLVFYSSNVLDSPITEFLLR